MSDKSVPSRPSVHDVTRKQENLVCQLRALRPHARERTLNAINHQKFRQQSTPRHFAPCIRAAILLSVPRQSLDYQVTGRGRP